MHEPESHGTPQSSAGATPPPPPPPTEHTPPQSGPEQSATPEPQEQMPESSAATPQTQQPAQRRRFGWPALISSVALASVLGAGTGILAYNTLTPSVNSSNESIQLNRNEDVTAVTQAAAVASPSVVTLAVGGDQAEGSGSGVILDTEGHILTNNHVITLGGQSAATDVRVQTHTGEVYDAQVVGLDPLSDLAVIKIEAQDLQPIEIGSVDDLNVGDQAVAIGAPMGLSGTVTQGIISTLERTISVASSAVPEESETPPEESPFEFRFPDSGQEPAQLGQIHLNVLQSDAAINPGNSGGALVDQAGRLIGINVAIATRTEGNVGLGFAIPVDYAHRVAQEIIQNGQATHGMLGVSIVPASNEGLVSGAQVVEIVENGPADNTQLQAEDTITHLNDRRIGGPGELSATVREFVPGTEVQLTVQRGSEEFTETVILGSAE